MRLRDDTASRVTEDAVRDYCRGRLAHFKIPRSAKLDSGSWSFLSQLNLLALRFVFIVENFPTTVTGKVQKFKMREQTEQWINDGK